MTGKTLYERLGGYDAIAAVTSDLLTRLMADARLGRFWQNRGEDGINREKQLLIDYLCANAGGPVLYTGRDNKTSHKGMGISESDWEKYRKESRDTSLVNAHFATRHVDVSTEFVQELQHPKIHKISGEFLTEKLSKFAFRDLQMREMDDLMRIKIDRILEQMKASRWKDYDGSIRRVYLITELYYGSIRILIEKKYSSELEASMKKVDLRASGKSEGSHAVEYEFSHDNVPFAMRIEKVRTFNG